MAPLFRFALWRTRDHDADDERHLWRATEEVRLLEKRDRADDSARESDLELHLPLCAVERERELESECSPEWELRAVNREGLRSCGTALWRLCMAAL